MLELTLMGALLALIPTKDWFIGAAFAIALMLGWHYWDKYYEAVDYAQTVKAESRQALDGANAHIADLTLQHNADLVVIQEKYDAEIKAAAAVHATDLERLRQLTAARNQDPVLSGASGLAAAIAAWSARLGRLEGISSGLADAVRADDAAATECWRDRDALTGK
jgi:hypothetical protein